MPKKINVLFAIRDYAGEAEVFTYAHTPEALTFAVCDFYSGVLTPAGALAIGEQIKGGMRDSYFLRVNTTLRDGTRLTFVVQYGLAPNA